MKRKRNAQNCVKNQYLRENDRAIANRAPGDRRSPIAQSGIAETPKSDPKFFGRAFWGSLLRSDDAADDALKTYNL